MEQMSRDEWEWLQKHARIENGVYVCKQTGATIATALVPRSLWFRGFMGGPGEVESILHVCCPSCQPGKVPPERGTSIYEDDIVTVDVNPVFPAATS